LDKTVGDQVKVQYVPSIDVLEVNQVDGFANWTTPIVSYLKDRLLSEDAEEARKLRIKAAKFVLMDELLYKRDFSQPYLRCLTLDESHYVLRDVYEGACGNQSGVRSLVHKIVRAGYYCPTIQVDARLMSKHVIKCQRYSNIPRRPSEYLTPMVAPCPFA